MTFSASPLAPGTAGDAAMDSWHRTADAVAAAVTQAVG
jgi:hypothetical protein